MSLLGKAILSVGERMYGSDVSFLCALPTSFPDDSKAELGRGNRSLRSYRALFHVVLFWMPQGSCITMKQKLHNLEGITKTTIRLCIFSGLII